MHGGTGASRRQALVTGGQAAGLVRSPAGAGAPAPGQVHVQFGADAASQAAVSWAAPAAVSRPRLKFGRPGPGFGTEIPAQERVYTEAHDRRDRLHLPRAAGPAARRHLLRLRGAARRGPAGGRDVPHRAARPVPVAFRFTSFGDQSVPAPVGRGLGPATANAGYIVDAVDALDPLFHLTERRPLLREPQRRAGRHLDLVLHQQHALGQVPAVDAGRGQPRERGGQRAAGLSRLPDQVRAARQRLGGVRRPLVRVHGRPGPGDRR